MKFSGKIGYVAGPFSGPDVLSIRRNIRAAAALAHEVRKLGCGAIVPHLIGAPYIPCAADAQHDDCFGYDWWIEETKEQMRRCDFVILVEDWERSSGSRGEVAEMQRLGKPVFRSIDELRAWLEPVGEVVA